MERPADKQLAPDEDRMSMTGVRSWIQDHPGTALLLSGAAGLALGALAMSAAPERHVPGEPPDEPRAPSAGADWLAAVGALLGAAASAAVALKATRAEGDDVPDPIGDLADTDAFAEAPSVDDGVDEAPTVPPVPAAP